MSANDPPTRQPARRPRATRSQLPTDNVGSRLVGASQMLTGVGTLLAGLAAIVAILLANTGGSGGGSSVTSIPTVAASEAVTDSVTSPLMTAGIESPVTTDEAILFRDSLDGLVPGMFEGVSGRCTHHFDEGYHIEVVAREDQGIVCADGLEDVAPALADVASVRVEVTVRFLDSEPSTSTVFGPGDAGIQCRLRGMANTGDYYIGSLSPTGYWEIDRFDAGQQKLLSSGVVPDLTTESGTPRRIGLECLGDPGKRTVVRFSVDGRIIGSVVDEAGLETGSVGLGATGYPGGRLEVAFEELEVEAR